METVAALAANEEGDHLIASFVSDAASLSLHLR